MIIVTLQSVFSWKIRRFCKANLLWSLGLLINAIKNRFEREDYKRCIILENLLLKCAKNESYAHELETVFSNYSEFQREQLPQQLEQFSTACCQVEEKDFPLILVLPATNASSERSFSLLRLLKSYLRATTGQGWLNHVMILSAHKENADELNLKDVARAFIHKNDTRISLFGKI